jgi:hypothetical protein
MEKGEIEYVVQSLWGKFLLISIFIEILKLPSDL